jgi:hypothetical protein
VRDVGIFEKNSVETFEPVTLLDDAMTSTVADATTSAPLIYRINAVSHSDRHRIVTGFPF